MSRETQQALGRNSMRQTMMQGLKALGGKDVPNYTLLFMNPTKNKMKGDFQTIVVPYAELGRSSKCVIQYGDDFPTVSRVHGAIQWNNGETYYKHLGSNPSLVNGQEVPNFTKLSNGDEIQLSYEGPRIRFNTSAVKTSTFKFTQRMALFAQQALKPYKTLVYGLWLLLLAVAGTSAYMIFNQKQDISKQQILISESTKKIEELTGNLSQKQNLIASNTSRLQQLTGLVQSSKTISASVKASYEAEIAKINQQNAQLNKEVHEISRELNNANTDGTKAAANIEVFKNDVFLIIASDMVITAPGGSEPQKVEGPLWTGTGFLSEDGRFFTARHIVAPWKFYNKSTDDQALSYLDLEQNGGSIIVNFIAYSPSGEKIKFSSSEVKFSDNEDEITEINGKNYRIATKVNADWAYVYINNITGVIKTDKTKSKDMVVGEMVYAYGYQNPDIALDRDRDIKDMKPSFSTATVSQPKLVNGLIQTTNIGFDHGASGGPVFVKVGNDFKAVGIISSVYGNQQGVIVPLANIR